MKYYCKDCGKESYRTGKYIPKRCMKCYLELRKRNKIKRHCLKCGCELLGHNKSSNYCRKHFQLGENNPNWKGGHPKCIDCGRTLSHNYNAIRCNHCNLVYFHKNKILDFRGNNNPNWQGGIQNLPYPFGFNEQLKEQIRKRDNYTCQNCGMTEEEHLIVIGNALAIHHIDYNKENCKENNLITLCNQCNVRANYNRSYWQDYFKSKLLIDIKRL